MSDTKLSDIIAAGGEAAEFNVPALCDGVVFLATCDKINPGMMMAASKDPVGGDLDRIQVVKAWIDARGESHETIYDVALSDGRISAEVAGILFTHLVCPTVKTEASFYGRQY